ncbi:MAG: choice-of-anchor tandem repeat GloVer-containing protein [Candidatus Cybelea sp.]
MRRWNLSRGAASVCIAAALLAGCGGSPPLTGVPGAMPQSDAIGDATHYKVLHSFNGQDGQAPLASLIELNGTLYGTSSSGGANGDGTVFSITADGDEHVLHSFGPLSGSDGVYPAAALIDVNGTLYGTTADGGNPITGGGTFFSVATNGTERVLHDFGERPTAPSFPAASVIDVNGTLYSTSDWGGRQRYTGTAFQVSTHGRVRTIYSFASYPGDGYFPSTGVIDVNGRFYGTTYIGGVYGTHCAYCPGDGTFFSLSPAGTEHVLHSFGHRSDGVFPEAPLIDVKGILYGTTFQGGAHRDGIVFRIDTAGAEKVLYSFQGGTDGANPAAGLIDVNGTLYGTTQWGGRVSSKCTSPFGNSGCGTIFSLHSNGSAEHVLHRFGTGSDGQSPVAGLLYMNGTLYGTTSRGGAGPCYRGTGCGTVFALTL